MAWTVTEIQTKIKVLVGDSGLENDDLLGKINRMYRNVLPLEFHLVSLENALIVPCVDGTDAYDVDPDIYLSVIDGLYLDDLGAGYLRQLRFRTDRAQYWLDYPEPTTAGTHTKGVPEQVLFWMNMLYPRPVPDDAYWLCVLAYKKPDALEAVDDTPDEDLWGPMLACDVAAEILAERKDLEGCAPVIEERKFWKKLIIRKEILALGDIRAEGRI